MLEFNTLEMRSQSGFHPLQSTARAKSKA